MKMDPIIFKGKFLLITFLYLLTLTSVFVLIVTSASMAQAPSSKEQDSNKIIVYYFHGNFRCRSCRTIEEYTKEAIKANFSKETTSGMLEFKPINVDEKQNRHYIKDYQLYTKSVVISGIKNGQQISFKNLEKVWHLLKDKKGFHSYIKEEIEKYLKLIK